MRCESIPHKVSMIATCKEYFSMIAYVVALYTPYMTRPLKENIRLRFRFDNFFVNGIRIYTMFKMSKL